MNPYLIIAALLAVIASGAAGFKLGADHELAAQSREDAHIAKAVASATQVSAEAISKLSPVYTTIQGKVIHEISTRTVYADCRHSPDGLLLINQALNGGAIALGSGKLSSANPGRK